MTNNIPIQSRILTSVPLGADRTGARKYWHSDRCGLSEKALSSVYIELEKRQTHSNSRCWASWTQRQQKQPPCTVAQYLTPPSLLLCTEFSSEAIFASSFDTLISIVTTGWRRAHAEHAMYEFLGFSVSLLAVID